MIAKNLFTDEDIAMLSLPIETDYFPKDMLISNQEMIDRVVCSCLFVCSPYRKSEIKNYD